MKFYDHLAQTYDYFIDWDERIKREDPFFQHIFRERLGTNVLDLGCGTGGYSIYLAELGYNVVGIDNSKEMIEIARQKADLQEVDIEFQCLSMTDFSNKLNTKFDAIICDGNSITHLLEEAKMKRMFDECIASMKITGAAIFHVLNYRRILENKRRDFPTKSRVADGKEYVFSRFYDYKATHMDFHMVVSVKENGAWHSRSFQMMHRPWQQNELLRIAQEAGFGEINCYGGYDFSEFNPEESDNLLMVCEPGED